MMTHTRKRIRLVTDSEKPSIVPEIYQFISRNPFLPKLPSRIRPNHPEAQKLLEAIQTGDANADIFSHPNCYIYLLHLLETEQISRQEGMTVYGYLLALTQYTEKQPIKECDLDTKTIRKVKVYKLFVGGQITKGALNYFQMVCDEFEKLHIKITKDELIAQASNLQPTEQWLVTVYNDIDRPYREYLPTPQDDYQSSDTLKNLIFGNSPYMGTSGGEINAKDTAYFMPSTSILEFLFSKISDKPLKMQPIFGVISLETIREMHKRGAHPIAYYSKHVKNNLYDADKYRAGPYIAWIHDVWHTFAGSLLKPSERDSIFETLIPFLERAKRDALENRDPEIVEGLDEMIMHLGDFDLSAIDRYFDPETRFKLYLERWCGIEVGYGINPFLEQVRFFILLHKIYNQSNFTEEERGLIKTILPKIDFDTEPAWTHLQGKRAMALLSIADNDVHKNFTYANAGVILKYSTSSTPVDWQAWYELLNSTSDSGEIWVYAVGHFEEQLLTLINDYNIKFFYPHMPLTESEYVKLVTLVEEQIELKDRSEDLMEHSFFAPKRRLVIAEARSNDVPAPEKGIKRKHD